VLLKSDWSVKRGFLKNFFRPGVASSIDARFMRRYFSPMSTVTEVKVATERLSPQDRWELYRWLGESKDVQRFRHEELRREIAIGIEQADSGNVAAFDTQAVKDEVRRRLNVKGQ
jgi:hypothetical protein